MNIYVGNLPYSATQEALEALFAQHGSVTSVRIITDKFTGAPRGFAFVDHKSEHSNTDHSEKSIGLQLTTVKVRREESDRAEQLYGPNS